MGNNDPDWCTVWLPAPSQPFLNLHPLCTDSCLRASVKLKARRSRPLILVLWVTTLQNSRLTPVRLKHGPAPQARYPVGQVGMVCRAGRTGVQGEIKWSFRFKGLFSFACEFSFRPRAGVSGCRLHNRTSVSRHIALQDCRVLCTFLFFRQLGLICHLTMRP